MADVEAASMAADNDKVPKARRTARLRNIEILTTILLPICLQPRSADNTLLRIVLTIPQIANSQSNNEIPYNRACSHRCCRIPILPTPIFRIIRCNGYLSTKLP
ncbi:MAG: hypothetical protein DWH78_04605 [Planctomycetota bacterium]|nr:MAG: hypothetical protein DWH78_04605 [Planctomycetota bacterium]